MPQRVKLLLLMLDPMWSVVRVLVTALPIQLPANDLEKAVEGCPSTPVTHVRDTEEAVSS